MAKNSFSNEVMSFEAFRICGRVCVCVCLNSVYSSCLSKKAFMFSSEIFFSAYENDSFSSFLAMGRAMKTQYTCKALDQPHGNTGNSNISNL